jgi:hypothetical protein
MENSIMRIRIGISLLLLIVGVGCTSPNQNTTAQTYTSTPMGTPTRIITVTSTPTYTPNPTHSPTPTSTSSPLPTWTPLPTLEPTAALALVTDLLKNNAGCQLPGWWGLTPGKTTWAEALQYLESFSYSYVVQGDPNDYLGAAFMIPFPKDMYPLNYRFDFRNGILEDIFNIYLYDLTKSYNLVEILNTYGKPDDILISAYYEPRYSDYMTHLVIFYLKKGILLEYYDSGGRLSGDKKQICPQKATYPYLSLWSPALNMSLQDGVNRYVDTFNWPDYRTLEDSTGVSVETFYQTFKDVNNHTCIELNTADWPKY